MRYALNLAQRGLGQVWPNPAVGCVLVRSGVIVGRGWTQPGGRPHAEVKALAYAQEKACGATAYVTLEPCSHFGKTPPCSDALIAAGVKRVVIACTDPDPRVNGNGIQRLREAGLSVSTGVLEAEATALNAGFFSKVQLGRPHVHLKIATTLDGAVANKDGKSQWITGPKAREEGHRLRSICDAVLTGAGTLAADDPLLTVRLPGLESHQPVRIVLEGQTAVSETAQIWATTNISPVWLITSRNDFDRDRKLEQNYDVKCIHVKADKYGRPCMCAAMTALAAEGITRVLIEAGAKINAAALDANIIDAISWFRAPSIMGGDGLSGIASLGLSDLENLPNFRLIRRLLLDRDVLEDYLRTV